MAGKLEGIDNWALLLNVALVQTAMVIIAFAMAWLGDFDLVSQLSFTWDALWQGFAATAALVGFTYATRWMLPGVMRQVDKVSVELFANSNIKLNWRMIVSLSALAGIGEEMLFRGAMQGWLATHLSVVLAIAIPNILFALAHPHSRLFAAVVFFIGTGLGISYAITDNLLVAIFLHSAYDVFALSRVRRLVETARIGAVKARPGEIMSEAS